MDSDVTMTPVLRGTMLGLCSGMIACALSDDSGRQAVDLPYSSCPFS